MTRVELELYLDKLTQVDIVINKLYQFENRGLLWDIRQFISSEYDKDEICQLVKNRLKRENSHDYLDNPFSEYSIGVKVKKDLTSYGISKNEQKNRCNGVTTNLINDYIQAIFRNPNKTYKIEDVMFSGIGIGTTNMASNASLKQRLLKRIGEEIPEVYDNLNIRGLLITYKVEIPIDDFEFKMMI